MWPTRIIKSSCSRLHSPTQTRHGGRKSKQVVTILPPSRPHDRRPCDRSHTLRAYQGANKHPTIQQASGSCWQSLHKEAAARQIGSCSEGNPPRRSGSTAVQPVHQLWAIWAAVTWQTEWILHLKRKNLIYFTYPSGRRPARKWLGNIATTSPPIEFTGDQLDFTFKRKAAVEASYWCQQRLKLRLP